MQLIDKWFNVYPEAADMCEVDLDVVDSSARILPSEDLLAHIHKLAANMVETRAAPGCIAQHYGVAQRRAGRHSRRVSYLPSGGRNLGFS